MVIYLVCAESFLWVDLHESLDQVDGAVADVVPLGGGEAVVAFTDLSNQGLVRSICK